MESAGPRLCNNYFKSRRFIETFDNDLIVENLTSSELFKKIEFLIKNPKKLRFYQYKNFKNPKHIINDLVNLLDAIKHNYLKNIFINKSIGPK